MHLLIAYAAGLLSFLAPCGMFLIPAFFGYAFDGANRRITATWVLLAGFSTLFIPVGLGAYALGAQLALHRRELTWIGGAIMILAGLFALSGRTLGGLLPHLVVPGKRDPRSLTTVYLLGASFGVTIAGCSAPLLAITLAMAGTSTNVVAATAILLAYVIGLGTPLLALAAAADQTDLMSRFAWIVKTWQVRLPGYRRNLRATDAVAGFALVMLGTVFIVSQGTFYVSDLLGNHFLVDANVNAATFLSGFR